MSFTVKDYYSRTDWTLGKGGYGTVYSGYRIPPSEHNSLGNESYYATSSTPRSSPRSSPKSSLATRGPMSTDQVAIKLEKCTISRPSLALEAKILRYLHDAEGIPQFHLFSHTTLPLKPLRLSSHNPNTPPTTPLLREQLRYHPSPLSSPAQSLVASSTSSVEAMGITPRTSQYIERERFNALVMERLGDSIEAIFRRFMSGFPAGKDDAFYRLTGARTSASTVEKNLSSEVKRKAKAPKPRPIDVSPYFPATSAPGSAEWYDEGSDQGANKLTDVAVAPPALRNAPFKVKEQAKPPPKTPPLPDLTPYIGQGKDLGASKLAEVAIPIKHCSPKPAIPIDPQKLPPTPETANAKMGGFHNPNRVGPGAIPKASGGLPAGYPVGINQPSPGPFRRMSADEHLAAMMKRRIGDQQALSSPESSASVAKSEPTPGSQNQYGRRKGWDVHTVVWVGCQLLRRLEYVHGKGIVHRDIPENICLGYGEKRNILYLIDFGMAQSFLLADGEHVPKFEESTGCVGTQNFMSHRVGGSRRDDIESCAYVLLYFYKGSLPWSNRVDRFEASFAKSGQQWTPETIDLNHKIQVMKQRMITDGEGLDHTPRELRALFQYIKEMRFADEPDYHYLRATLQDMRRRIKEKEAESPKSSAPLPDWRRPGYLET